MALRLPGADPDHRAGRPRRRSRCSTRTWRPVGMCTRTLSTIISISVPRSPSMRAIIPRGQVREGRRGLAAEPERQGHQHARQEPADVGEERHAAVSPAGAERADPVEQLEHEPEPEHEHGRHRDQLVEEARGTPATGSGPRGTARGRRRGPRRSRPTRRSSGRPTTGRRATWPATAASAADQVEDEEHRAARASPRRCCRRSRGTACCRAGAASRRAGTCW